MKQIGLSLSGLLLLACPVVAQEKLDKPLVLLPEMAAPTPAAPIVSPTAPIRLDASQLYIVRSSVQCVVVASPDGLVKVTAMSGPVLTFARFVDGGDKYEKRTYAEKFVWTIEAVATGTCELLILPAGGAEKDIVRRTIDCNVGPRPPPTPPDPPKPDPPGPVTPTKLYVIVVEETAALAAERGKLFGDKALNSRFIEKGHKWRIVDKDVVGPDGAVPKDVAGYIQAASGKALPQLFLVDPTGKLLHSGNLPRTAPELLAVIQKVGG